MAKRYERREGRLCARSDDEAGEATARKRSAPPPVEHRRSSKAAKTKSNPELDDDIVHGIMNGGSSVQLECTTGLRRLLSDANFKKVQRVIDAVLETGITSSLVEFLKRDDEPELQAETAWVIANIFVGTSKQVQRAMKYGALPHLMRLIDSPNDAACENATNAIGNIAGDSPACRDRVLKAGAMSAVLKALGYRSEIGIRRSAAWALTNLCRGNPAPELEAAIPILAETMVGEGDSQILTDSCIALLGIVDGSKSKLTNVFEVDAYPRIVELIGHDAQTVGRIAVRAVAHIAMGDERRVRALLDCGILNELKKVLSKKANDGISEDACWTWASICGGSEAQIQAVLDSGTIETLVSFLPGTGKIARKWIAIAMSNAASRGNSEQVNFLAEAGCIRALCELLDDRGVVNIALDGLEHFLRAGDEASGKGENVMIRILSEVGGTTKIKEMEQSHSAEGVRKKCRNIIEEYC